jgi:hypothetical protein
MEDRITVNGIEYIRAGAANVSAQSLDGLPYVIIRSDRAGVFAGHLASRDGQEVVLRNVRRLWYWSGAASLSQLAMDGVSKPNGCKFSVVVPEQTVLTVIEIIPASEKARQSVLEVPEWKV